MATAGGMLWLAELALSVGISGSHAVLLHASKDHHNQYPYAGTQVVFMQELIKLIVCVTTLASRSHTPAESKKRDEGTNATYLLGTHSSEADAATSFTRLLRSWAPFMVPSLFYAINNNLAIFLQTQMDSATFQMLCNFKILTTAVLFAIVFRRRLAARQWLALLLLFTSGVVLSRQGLIGTAPRTNLHVQHITLLGLGVMLLYCSISGLAGVYSEWILKNQNHGDFFQQGVKMYGIGAAMNLVAAASRSTGPFFAGFSAVTWVIVLTQATNGLIYAHVMKRANNIARLFMISVSVLVAASLSVTVHGVKLAGSFYVSCAMTVAALAMYYGHTMRKSPRVLRQPTKHEL